MPMTATSCPVEHLVNMPRPHLSCTDTDRKKILDAGTSKVGKANTPTGGAKTRDGKKGREQKRGKEKGDKNKADLEDLPDRAIDSTQTR